MLCARFQVWHVSHSFPCTLKTRRREGGFTTTLQKEQSIVTKCEDLANGEDQYAITEKKKK